MICGSCHQPIPEGTSYISHRETCDRLEKWKAHLEAMTDGRLGRARRIERQAFGIPSKPMSEEAKARLASPEYKAKAKAKAEERRIYKEGIRATIRAMVAKRGRTIRRKG